MTGLCKESGMGQQEVEHLLGELKNQKLVDWKMITRKAGDQKQRWFITEAGREELARVESASPADVAVQAGDDSQGQSW
jgi:DNA-binding PadR family transcriptional regulator